MEDFCTLIETLGIKSIFIFENDFLPPDNPERIFGCYLGMSESRRKNFISSLTEENGLALLNLLKDSHYPQREDLSATNPSLWKALLPNDAKTFFEQTDKEKVASVEQIILEIEKLLVLDHQGKFKESCLRHGIFKTPIPEYKAILDACESIQNLQIILFPTLPQPLSNWVSLANEERYAIAVIDNVMGESNAGYHFVKEVIGSQNEFGGSTKFLSFIFTSDPSTARIEGEDQLNYLREIIDKQNNDHLERITESLLKAAIGTVLNSMKQSLINGAEAAFKLGMSHPQNLYEMLQKSHLEGISPIESLKYWLGLATNFNSEKRDVEDIYFIAGITNFFSRKGANAIAPIPEIGEGLEAINSWDLFDSLVNMPIVNFTPSF